MTQTTIKLTKLTAADGMILTNGDAYSEEIYLGCNDKAENWHEITRAEYDAIMKEQEETENLNNI